MSEIIREVDGDKGRYVLRRDGAEAKLTYSIVSPSEIVADHTYVPPQMRGTGAAKALVARLVDDARREGVTITPTCWFVADERDRHPDWADVFAT